MRHERLGLVGGIAADRPLIVAIVLAFGLTSIAIAGATSVDAAYGAALGMPDLLISLLIFAAAPLLLGAIPARSRMIRILIVVTVALLFLGLFFMTSVVDPFAGRVTLEAGAIIIALSAAFIFFGANFGAIARFAFIATVAAAFGVAGGLGLFALETPESTSAVGAFPTLAFALAAGVGIGVLADFSSLFAKGADAQRAAGVAAQYASAPAVYAAILTAAVAFGNEPALSLSLSWVAPAAVILAVAASLFTTSGALASRQASEMLAIEENRRQQSFRQLWRPVRRTLAPSFATAMLAVLGISTIAAAFNLTTPISLPNIAVVAAASIAAVMMFLSLQTGVFVFITLFSGIVLATWLWNVIGGPTLTNGDVGIALAMTAALYAQLGVAWRDARSPRLNARETTEAAMSDGLPTFVVSVVIAIAAFWAAQAAGVWSAGGSAALLVALLAVYGIIVGPAAMTALTHVLRRQGR